MQNTWAPLESLLNANTMEVEEPGKWNRALTDSRVGRGTVKVTVGFCRLVMQFVTNLLQDGDKEIWNKKSLRWTT